MEVVIAIIIFLLVIAFIVYVVLPILGIMSVVLCVACAGYAFITSIGSFIASLQAHINPYATYVDVHKDVPEGVRRNYFFGPGFHQIAITVKDACTNQSEHLKKLKEWKETHAHHVWYVNIWILGFYYIGTFCTSVLGYLWMAVFSVILAVVIIVGMSGFFLFFSILWMIDRCTLLFKAIQSRCPNCKRISLVPTFVCPDCGAEHRNLTPGPYGIFKRKCSCRKILATTYMNGRSSYTAMCPYCGSKLVTSSARQYGIQLVGGVGAGKTTFLAAFWHEYTQKFKDHRNISIAVSPAEAFETLETWFQTGSAEATTERNASMYSIIHSIDDETPVQMTIYDIAGEAFDLGGTYVQQLQFKYCEGFILMIDPTASPSRTAELLISFVNTYEELNGKRSSNVSAIPVAIAITKSDLFKREIGLPRLRTRYKNNIQKYTDENGVQHFLWLLNEACSDFLSEHDYGIVLNLIDAAFNNIQFFPISAMGHPQEDGEYEPWGVMEPILWLLSQENSPLQKIASQIVD